MEELAENEVNFTTSWFQSRSQSLWEKFLVPRAPFHAYLEIGVFEAASLKWVTDRLLSRDGRAVGVDWWRGARSFESAQLRASAARLIALKVAESDTRMKLIESESNAFLCRQVLDGGSSRFDLCFCDGSHMAETALVDMCLAWKLLEPGGVMVVDDINLHAGRRRSAGVPKTREAVEAFVSTHFRTDSDPRDTVLFSSNEQIAYIKPEK